MLVAKKAGGSGIHHFVAQATNRGMGFLPDAQQYHRNYELVARWA